MMLKTDEKDYCKGMNIGSNASGEWKVPAILFITITVMVFLLVILLPDSPFEFW